MAVETYEELPYTSVAYTQSTPSRMAVIARLFGLAAPDPTQARVLEIGCAAGGNLIPYAVEHPDSRWVGLEPAANQAAMAQTTVDALGLRNVAIEQRGLETLGPEDGPFDYVVVHGVFSWVSPELRATMLDKIRELLVPEGVAYISYNTLPGWHMRGMVRDAMLFHAAGQTDPASRVAAARWMLQWLAQASPGVKNPWTSFLETEHRLLSEQGDAYLFHDHLSPDNDPLYVHQFVESCVEHGLAYLGEATLDHMMTIGLPDEVRKVLESVSPDLIRTQQYLDFVLNRAFRASLLVHAEQRIDHTIAWQRATELYASSPLRCELPPDPLRAGERLRFLRGRLDLTTDDPLVKAGWLVFQERHPEPIRFDAWVDEVLARVAAAGEEAPEEPRPKLARNLLFAYAQDLAELWPHPVVLPPRDVERPVGFAYARLSAARGEERTTNRRHENCRLTPLDAELLKLCDGTRDRAALVDGCVQAVARGDLVWTGEEAVASPQEARSRLEGEVPVRIEVLRELAMLNA